MKPTKELIYKTILVYILFSVILCKEIAQNNTFSIILTSIWLALHITSDVLYYKNIKN